MSELPLDVAAIVKLVARAQTAIDEYQDLTHQPTPREELRLRSAELALVAAARLVAHTRAIGLIRDVRRWAEISPVGEDPISILWALAEALIVAVHDGLAREQLEPLLAGLDDWMLAKVALALDPQRADDLAILQKLADDPRPEIAAAACRRLGPRRQWCWHAGIFEHDPITAHADEPALVESLGSARKALGREYPGAEADLGALYAAIEGLPAALAMPLLEAGLLVVPSIGSRRAEPDERLVVQLHALGGVDAIVGALERLVQAHGDPEPALRNVARWCLGLSESIRVELALRLLPWIEAEPEETHGTQQTAKIRGAARLVAAIWPDTVAPIELLEWLVRTWRRYSVGFFILKRALERTEAELEPHADRLLELAQARPELVGELPKLFDALGRRVSLARLAALTDAAAGSGHDRLRIWALEQRTDRLAPSEAAERHALAQAWLDDPDTRQLILRSEACSARLLPWLRRRLQAGALTLAEANTTMAAIGELYGGAIEAMKLGPGPDQPTELEAAERRTKARSRLGVWLDAPNGPPTSQEWASLRALARRALEQGGRPWEVLAVRPIGPWTAEDLALREALGDRAIPGVHEDPASEGARLVPTAAPDWMDEEELDS